MKSRWIAALLAAGSLSSPALADDETRAATGRRDYPTSSLLVSPTELAWFAEPKLGLSLTQTKSLERQTFDGGELNDDATARTTLLSLARRANPSVYWGLTAARYDEVDEANDTLETGDRKVESTRTATVFGLGVAYKIMDRVVIALGAKSRQVDAVGDSGPALHLNHLAFAAGLAVKSEWYELGLAQNVMTYRQANASRDERRYRREVLLHGRYHTSADLTLGFLVTKNPQPACCLGLDSNRMRYAFSAESQQGEWKSEVLYAYLAAVHERRANGASLHDVARHSLEWNSYYALANAWTLEGRLGAEQGAEQGSQVAIPRATGAVDKADVKTFSWSAGLGAVLAL